MCTLECNPAILSLFYLEVFPDTCMVAVPFRTPVGLSAQVLSVYAPERDPRPLINEVQGSLHAPSGRRPDMALFGSWRETAV